jgi:hypothetical protein
MQCDESEPMRPALTGYSCLWASFQELAWLVA